jgi:hypothetical protein
MLYTALKKAAAALLLIGSFGLAQASAPVHDLGNLTTTVAYSNTNLSPSFDDIFKFTVGTGNTALLGGLVGTTDDNAITFNLQTGSNGTTWSPAVPLVLTADSNTGAFSFSQTVSGLTTGATYWFRLSGTTSGGDYTITLAPVPEPETYAMLLAGLGLMGVIARRRKAGSTSFGV